VGGGGEGGRCRAAARACHLLLLLPHARTCTITLTLSSVKLTLFKRSITLGPSRAKCLLTCRMDAPHRPELPRGGIDRCLPCPQAGADHDLNLMWTVILAAFVAFVLQKEAARLTMESRMSLGAAMRVHFGRARATTTTTNTSKDSTSTRTKGDADPSIDPRLCQAEQVTLLSAAL
jgi:hypothetical protein